MSVLWRPRVFFFFHRHTCFYSQSPKCSTHSFHRENTTSFRGSGGTFDSGGCPPQMVGQKAGPPWNCCFFVRNFLHASEEEERCSSDCCRDNRTCLHFLDASFFASRWASWVASGCANLAYLPWKDMGGRGGEEEEEEAWGRPGCSLRLDRIHCSLGNDNSK